MAETLKATQLTDPARIKVESGLSMAFAVGGVVFLGWAILSGFGRADKETTGEGVPAVPAKQEASNAQLSSAPSEGSGVNASPLMETEEPRGATQLALHVEQPPAEAPALVEAEPTATRGPGAVVRWSGPLARALNLLEEGKAAEALEAATVFAKESDAPAGLRRPAMAIQGRAYLKMGKWREAHIRFHVSLETNGTLDDAARADAAWGLALAASRGQMETIPETALEGVLKHASRSWGYAMARYELGRRHHPSARPGGPHDEDARALFQDALLTGMLEAGIEADCEKRLTDLTWAMLLNPKCLAAGGDFHTVQPGESLYKIARRTGVEVGGLCRLNGLDPQRPLHAGKVLKVLKHPIHAKVDTRRLTLTLFSGPVFLKRYPVCIGPGEKTPRGTFGIEKKLVNPDWYYEGRRHAFGSPENILGTRWLGFDPAGEGGKGSGIGLHGTTVPDSIPGRESKGCVRMLNAAAEEVYDFLPRGGKVEIAP